MKKLTLLIITNSAKAKLYDIAGDRYLLIEEIEHSESRLKNQHLMSDKPGSYKSGHAAHGQFVPSSNPHEEEHSRFAKIVADFLKKMVPEKHYQQIILCAEPHFYGLLNQACSKSIKNLIVKVVEKDYIPLPENELNKVIEKLLVKPPIS